MQATFDAYALKSFTRALTCLSKYGEELCIYAASETLSLFCTNSSKSAYCRFNFGKEFFSRYRAGDPAKDTNDGAVGQLMAKSLLSILKHKTVESTLERCEISIVEGISPEEADDESHDGLESKLVVRLHCKHGVIKTHKLLLLGSTSLMAPGTPDPTNETLLTIGPRAIRDMIEQFSLPKGAKSDPQLIWTFGEAEVEVKSLESSLDTKSRTQLATELTISSDEFDTYNLYEAPTTITFHLREFNATIAFAETCGLGLDIRFTDPAEPLFINVEGDNFETLFVISTSQAPGSATQPRLTSSAPKKRLRENTPGDSSRFKKPAKVVQSTTDRASIARDTPDRRTPSSSRQVPPLATPATPVPNEPSQHHSAFTQLREEPPLFLPSASQLSILDEKALKESGLGIEHMSADEFNIMFEAEGEEINAVEAPPGTSPQAQDDFELVEEEPMFSPTQMGVANSADQSRVRYLSAVTCVPTPDQLLGFLSVIRRLKA
ncbi:Rad9-domain-containing protein [Rhodocollybia butyracea]|uniref:Rad9-domain-containing protein n=1 Tax=Rhodocollybia butyracea TaxID=206335 RepID=A0A9P5U8N5_9AGAR|nr:Rad9-domain-containing protein [Rhodocollybia butyracea]